MDRGFNNLSWFFGVVEDNNDPQMLGRVKVRCFGVHPIDKSAVPTEDLPWAYVITGTYNAAYKPPELNSWVFGFFLDGKGAQQPMLLGTLLGMPTMVPAAYGDSNGGFSSFGDGSNLNNLYSPDMSRLARGEELHNTSVLTKNATGGEPVNTTGTQKWTTPVSPYAAKYPNNYVHETKSGHVFEMDDTPGSERINLYHRSGSHIEVNSAGQTTIKSVGSAFIVMDQNGYIRIRGNASINVEGVADIRFENDLNMVVDGSMKQTVFGDYTLEVSGRTDINSGEAIRARGAKISMESATENIDILSKNDLNLQSGAITSIGSAGNIQMSGSQIHLNSDDNTAKSADGTDLKQPEQRKTVAKKPMADPLDMGASSDDTGTENEDTGNPTSSNENNQEGLNDDKKSLRDLIGTTEGTDAGRGYNETLGYGRYTGGDVNLTDMTLNQVVSLQGQMLSNPDNTFNSSALGRYQITRQTLLDYAPRLGYDLNTTKFTPAVQDSIANAIIDSTGGNVSKLRGRWTSLNKISNDQITATYYNNI